MSSDKFRGHALSAQYKAWGVLPLIIRQMFGFTGLLSTWTLLSFQSRHTTSHHRLSLLHFRDAHELKCTLIYTKLGPNMLPTPKSEDNFPDFSVFPVQLWQICSYILLASYRLRQQTNTEWSGSCMEIYVTSLQTLPTDTQRCSVCMSQWHWLDLNVSNRSDECSKNDCFSHMTL